MPVQATSKLKLKEGK